MTGWIEPGPLALAGVPALLYTGLRLRLSRAHVTWPGLRDLAFAAGVACVAGALATPLTDHDEWFPVHVVQHLLLGMAAPLAFALSAPVTLVLRAVRAPARRRILRVLHSPPVRWLCWPPVAAALAVGVLWPLYLTGVYAESLSHPLLHEAIHLHMLLAGSLLASVLVRADPIPGRERRGTVLAALFGALAAHAILAKYLYVHATAIAAQPDVGTAADWRAGAELLWYGGDLLDVMLVVAVFARWYRAGGRELRRQQRRQSVAAQGAAGCER